MSEEKGLHEFRIGKIEETVDNHEIRIRGLESNYIELNKDITIIQRDILKQQNMTLEMEKSIKESNERMQKSIQESNERLIENVVESVIKIIEIQNERDNERDKNKIELSKGKIAIICATITVLGTVIGTLLSKLL